MKLNVSSTDLDSLTCALLFSYIRSVAPPKGCFSPVYVPLLNIDAPAMRLRPEFTTVCEHAGISTSELITLSNIPSGFKLSDNIQWILVDHNKFESRQGRDDNSHVAGVIDHHDEELFVPTETEPEPRIIEKAGSCTSLVLRYCRTSWDSISSTSLSSGAGHAQGDVVINDSAVTQGWDAQIAKLALASILIDTANLQALEKVKAVDREAVDYLEAKIRLSLRYSKSWNREDYYETLDSVKKDIDHLNLEEILVKDYKQWTENGQKLGISSVVRSLQYLLQKAGGDVAKPEQQKTRFEKAVNDFMNEHDLVVFSIMTTSTSESGSFQRQIFLQTRSSANSIAKRFAGESIEQLGLEEISICATEERPAFFDEVWRKSWQQKDLGKSRKQVAPMLRKAMTS